MFPQWQKPIRQSALSICAFEITEFPGEKFYVDLYPHGYPYITSRYRFDLRQPDQDTSVSTHWSNARPQDVQFLEDVLAESELPALRKPASDIAPGLASGPLQCAFVRRIFCFAGNPAEQKGGRGPADLQ